MAATYPAIPQPACDFGRQPNARHSETCAVHRDGHEWVEDMMLCDDRPRMVCVICGTTNKEED